MILACICIVLTQFGNSLGDAIKFTHPFVAKYYDNLWHWIKWVFDRPSLFFAGFFARPIIEKQFKNDIWHYDSQFLIWFFIVVLSFFGWLLNYGCWKKYLKKKFDSYL